MTPLLEVEDLTVAIGGDPVLDGVSLTVGAGEVVALVGESGCGKSLTALAVMGLLPPAARRGAGAIRLGGRDLAGAPEAVLRGIRGRDAAMIFQEPVVSLNPLTPVGEQVAESLRVHAGLAARAAREAAVAMLARVGIREPALRARQYPFELSGGMCQRVMIAMALVCRPRLLVADEPTTALDVTVQKQILDLLGGLRAELGTALLLITHDMGVVAAMADRVCVMYAGRIVEAGDVRAVFERPRHPYTRLLLATIPRLDGPRKVALRSIEGVVPSPRDRPPGCRFAPRCPDVAPRCAALPPLAADAAGHAAACWFAP
jgi:peptide/nickel transport system ATP-binding protein